MLDCKIPYQKDLIFSYLPKISVAPIFYNHSESTIAPVIITSYNRNPMSHIIPIIKVIVIITKHQLTKDHGENK